MTTQNELIVLARKPLDKKTIVENVKEWGTGGINIDGCRIATDDNTGRKKYMVNSDEGRYNWNNGKNNVPMGSVDDKWKDGRFPSNVILDEEAAKVMDEQSGISKPKNSRIGICGGGDMYSGGYRKDIYGYWPSDNGGGASRFFKIIDNTINENKINNMNSKLLKGNNIELLKTLEDNSIDSILTDAPYGLSFMNKKWDYDVPSVELWKEVYRVLKPGGHILCFGGTRTYHRMVVNIEDAGFEIRDCIQWIYGSGFPKSLNIGKAMDKLEGNEREWISKSPYKASDEAEMRSKGHTLMSYTGHADITKGNTPYEGWGTGLKPANEPIVLARKPLDEKTIVENVKEWGTGGINIDGCRISHNEPIKVIKAQEGGDKVYGQAGRKEDTTELKENGRFPANVILECTCDEVIKGEKGEVKINNNGNIKTGDNGIYGQYKEIVRTNFTDKGDIHTNPNCPCYIMDEQSGETITGASKPKNKYDGGIFGGGNAIKDYPSSKGGASRFFYVAKVGKKERNMGLDGLEEKETKGSIGLRTIGGTPLYEKGNSEMINTRVTKNNHPTVKPINLLTYLCRMITPPNGVVLDIYMGSGSTGIAALLEGFNFVGMEMDEDYFNIAEARINNYEEYRKILK